MSQFAPLQSIAVPLPRANIDTDTIIPGTELAKFASSGYGDGLFAHWRYQGDSRKRVINPDFVLNDPAYAGAGILLAGPNFACGSSREPAVWALRDWGIRCIIAPSFGSIFYANCFKNRVLPIALPLEAVDRLMSLADKQHSDRTITVDLERNLVIGPDRVANEFTISAYYRSILLDDLDALDAVLQYRDQILEFQSRDRERRPWIYPGSDPAAGVPTS